MSTTEHKIAIAGLIAYILGAIITFGHAAAHVSHPGRDTTLHATTGIIAAMVWPLYWSWEAFEQEPRQVEAKP